jgi:hypothetical protein
MVAIEHLLIDLSLWRESETFPYVLEHIIELIDDPYSVGHLKSRILNTQICGNLLCMIVDDVIKPPCIGSAFDLLNILSESDEQLKQIGKTLVYSVNHAPNSLRPIVKVLYRQLSASQDFAARFEKFFGWELPLNVLDS